MSPLPQGGRLVATPGLRRGALSSCMPGNDFHSPSRHHVPGLRKGFHIQSCPEDIDDDVSSSRCSSNDDTDTSSPEEPSTPRSPIQCGVKKPCSLRCLSTGHLFFSSRGRWRTTVNSSKWVCSWRMRFSCVHRASSWRNRRARETAVPSWDGFGERRRGACTTAPKWRWIAKVVRVGVHLNSCSARQAS